MGGGGAEFFPGVEWLGYECNRLSLFHVEVKNERNFIYLLPICLHGVDKGHFLTHVYFYKLAKEWKQFCAFFLSDHDGAVRFEVFESGECEGYCPWGVTLCNLIVAHVITF
jgi:hypothetical protein